MDEIQRMFDQSDYESARIHPVGRPPKLTSELIEEICDLVIRGKSIARSAAARGVSESSIYRWLALGKKENAEPIYKELVERLAESCEISEFEALQTIRQANINSDNWRAAAWLLEHRFPEKYRKNAAAPTLQSDQSEFENPKPEDGTSGTLVSIA